jgi:hypothetical protein
MRRVPEWLRFVAIAGNVLYLLWVMYNGVSEGFRGTPVYIVTMIGVMGLFVLNAVILALDRSSD